MRSIGKEFLTTIDLVNLISKDQNQIHNMEIGRIILNFDSDGGAQIDIYKFREIMLAIRQHQNKLHQWCHNILEEIVLSHKEFENLTQKIK